MVSFNKALTLTLGAALASASPVSTSEALERRDNNQGFDIGSFLQIPNPVGIVPELIQNFINKEKCISDTIFGGDGKAFNGSIDGSLVVDIGLYSIKVYNNLNVTKQLVKVANSQPGLIKELAKDFGVLVNDEVADGQDFVENVADYIAAVIEVIGRNDFNGVPSIPEFLQSEVKKAAQQLGLTIEVADEVKDDGQRSLTLVKNFSCKVVNQFLKSTEGVVKCQVPKLDLSGVNKVLGSIIGKVC